MQNTCGSVRPPSVSDSTGASNSDAHVRWMYVVDNIMWSLELGSHRDELKSVLVGEVEPASAHMADSWGNYSDWSKFQFEFSPADDCIKSLPEASTWPEGIKVDIQACREMGMDDRLCLLSVMWWAQLS